MYLGGFKGGGNGNDVLKEDGYPSEAASDLVTCDGRANHFDKSPHARVAARVLQDPDIVLLTGHVE